MNLIRKIFISLLSVSMLSISSVYGQSIYTTWQNSHSSSIDQIYMHSDSVITRSCEADVVVSCVKSKAEGCPFPEYVFVVNKVESSEYYSFPLWEPYADTPNGDQITYYVNDMRISEYTCFFCGTKVITKVEEIQPMMGVNPEPMQAEFDTTIRKVGFVGRFSIREPLHNLIYDTNYTINIEITEIDETETLTKMCVQDGLHQEDYKLAILTLCTQCEPYDILRIYYDSLFTIDSAQAFFIGTLQSSNQSCLVEMKGLRCLNPNTTYMIRTSLNPDEVFEDITCTDNRMVMSSLFRNFDEMVGDVHFTSASTIGIRQKDMYNDNDEYQTSTNLYALPETNERLLENEYGHLCRLKSDTYCMTNGPIVTWHLRDDDFAVVFTSRTPDMGSEAHTSVYHIDINMDVNNAFRAYNPNLTYIPGCPILDVVSFGAYKINTIAIAYQSCYNYVHLVDWGYMDGVNNYMMFTTGYNRGARLNIDKVSSLDVFYNGKMLLMGLPQNHFWQFAMQRRRGSHSSNIADPQYDRTCYPAQEELGQSLLRNIKYKKYELKLDKYFNKEKTAKWEQNTPSSKKGRIRNICIKDTTY